MPFINFMNITRALSDENRARILMILRGNEFCVCQITAFLDLSPSTTSKHLSVLKQARLIEGKKEGKWVYYHLADAESPESYEMARGAIDWVERSIGDSQVARKDRERVRQILESERERYGIDGCRVSDEFHSVAVHSLEAVD
ncbi:MAG: metalloregulator ArsR/SmtB family transcription factor [Synergistaceae bacterium]|nr:metalloregulator ArsR/SmtB family transcription factor [Synergistaceae bacterium]